MSCIRMLRGTLPTELQPLLLRLQDTIASGDFQIFKVAPESQEAVVKSASAWQQSAVPKFKRLLAFYDSTDRKYAIKVIARQNVFRRLHFSLPGQDINARTYDLHRKALVAGISVIPMHAVLQILRFGLPEYSILVMDRLGHELSLGDYLRIQTAELSSRSVMPDLQDYLARGLANMHQRGFFHKDIKPYHCFLPSSQAKKNLGESDPTTWIWLDLDRSRVRLPLPQSLRVANVYQVWRYFLRPLGEEDPTAFVRAYLKGVGISVTETQRVTELVKRRYVTRYARSVKRGRESTECTENCTEN